MGYIEIEQSTVDEMQKEIDELEAENKELKEYVQHKQNCCVGDYSNEDSCDCGFDKLLEK